MRTGSSKRYSRKKTLRGTLVITALATALFLFLLCPATAGEESKEFVEAFNSGVDALNSGKPTRAIRDFKRAITASPDSRDAWYYLGFAYTAKGEHRSAAEAFKKTTSIDPEFVDGWNRLGYSSWQAGRQDVAAAAFEKSVSLKSDQADVLAALGSIYYGKKDWQKAHNALEKAVQIDPKMSKAHYNLGLAKNKLGKTGEAADSMDTAAELFEAEYNDLPEDRKSERKALKAVLTDALHNLGSLSFHAGEPDRAEAAFEKLISYDPGNHAAMNEMGKIQLSSDKPDRAKDSFRRAITLDPKNPDYYYNLGNAYSRTLDYETAILNYEKAIELKSDFAWAYFQIGEIKRVTHDYDKALEYYRNAAKADPKDVASYRGIGMIKYYLGEVDEAEAVFEMAVSLDEKDPTSLTRLGDISCDKGDYEKALKYYGKVEVSAELEKLKLKEKTAAAKYLMGLRKKAGRTLKAAKKRMTPSNPTVVRNDYFEIWTDAAPEFAEVALGLTVKILEGYEKEFGVSIPKGEKCKILMLANRKEYRQWCEENEPKLKENAGFYKSVENRIVLYKARGPAISSVREVLAHEILHFVMRTTFKTDFDSWLHEGCAEYYQLSTFEKDKPEIGGRNSARLEKLAGELRRGKAPALTSLFETVPVNFYGPRHGDFYSLAYSLVYFLKTEKKEAFDEYLNSLREKDRSKEKHWREFVAKNFKSLEKLDKAWKAFVMREG